MRIPHLISLFVLPLVAAACQQRYECHSHPIPFDITDASADDNDPDEAKTLAEDHMNPNIKSPLAFTLTASDGMPYPLSKHKGQVMLIVNTASKCGFTKQYAGLEAVYEKYKDQGFTVIAVPANNFNGQEPEDDETIRSFCSTNYNVSFPLMSKVSMLGKDICPLYQFLTSETPYDNAHDSQLALKGPIEWNFTKFLVDRHGNVVARFKPAQDPREKEVIAAIEKYLDEK